MVGFGTPMTSVKNPHNLYLLSNMIYRYRPYGCIISGHKYHFIITLFKSYTVHNIIHIFSTLPPSLKYQL